MFSSKWPAPGSKEALALGCKCPVIDNAYGQGIPRSGREPMFVFNAECPVHAKSFNDVMEQLLNGDDDGKS